MCKTLRMITAVCICHRSGWSVVALARFVGSTLAGASLQLQSQCMPGALRSTIMMSAD
jgi:hypothetical protein